MTRTYEATIRLEEGGIQKVIIKADIPLNAKKMIEAEYGVGSILTGPLQRLPCMARS